MGGKKVVKVIGKWKVAPGDRKRKEMLHGDSQSPGWCSEVKGEDHHGSSVAIKSPIIFLPQCQATPPWIWTGLVIDFEPQCEVKMTYIIVIVCIWNVSQRLVLKACSPAGGVKSLKAMDLFCPTSSPEMTMDWNFWNWAKNKSLLLFLGFLSVQQNT